MAHIWTDDARADFLKSNARSCRRNCRISRATHQKNRCRAVLRVTLTRGPGERGYTPRLTASQRRMTLHPAAVSEKSGSVELITSSIAFRQAIAVVIQDANKLITSGAHGSRGKGVDEGCSSIRREVAETPAQFVLGLSGQHLNRPTGCGLRPAQPLSVLELPTLGQR